MSAIAYAERKINGECLSNSCRRGRCSLGLKGIPEPYLLIDMDHDKAPMQSTGGKKCDYLFIGDEGSVAWIAPLELKGGTFRASEVLAQLQASAKVAERVAPSKAQIEFRPVLAYRRRAHRSEILRMRQNPIRFRDQDAFTALVKCGTSLGDALKKA